MKACRKKTTLRFPKHVLLVLLLFSMSGCAAIKIVHIPIPIPTFGLGGKKEKVSPEPVVRKPSDRQIMYNGEAVGTASWYGRDFQGKRTASGERYNMYDLTAAHRTLPFDTKVRVTNLENNKQIVVRINDRGPFKDPDQRIIDVSKEVARRLDFERQGLTTVRLEIIE